MADLERLVIEDFKGYLPGKPTGKFDPLPFGVIAQNVRLDGTLRSENQGGYSLDQTPFSTFGRLLLPFKDVNGTDRLIMSDGLDWKFTTGNGSSQYFGYTTGTVTRSGTALTGVGTDWDGNIEAGDQFKYDADSTWLNIASVNNDTSITLSTSAGGTSGAYTIRKRLSGTVLPTGVVLDGKAILTDNDRIHDYFDGNTLIAIANMPVMKGLVVHKRHIFGWTDTSIYWSDIAAPTTWTLTNTETVFKNDGGKILRCVSYANSLVIIKDNGKIYLFVGESPFSATNVTYNIIKADTRDDLGIIAPHTFVVYQNLLWFLTSIDWFTFDGVTVTRMDSPISGENGDYPFNPEFPTGMGGTTGALITENQTQFALGTLSDVEINSGGELQLKTLKAFSGTSWTETDGGSNLTEDDDTVTFADAGTTGGTGAVYMESANAYGAWEFVSTRNAIAQSGGQPIPNAETFVDIISDSTTYATRNGYRIRLEGAGNSTQWRNINLQKVTAGVASNLISYTTLTDSGCTIKVTRNATGTFELFVNGSSVGTATDTTFTSSTHLWCTFDGIGFYSGTLTLVVDSLKKTALSGTFTSQVLDGTAAIHNWLNIFYDETLNTQTLALSYRAEATNPPVGSFTTVAEGVDTNATARYFQYRLTFTSTNGLTPTVAEAEINYSVDNLVAQFPFAWVDDDKLIVSFTQSDAQISGYSSINSMSVLFDGKVWRKKHIPVFYVAKFKNSFYGCDSASGKLFLLNNTDQRDGTSFIRQFQTDRFDMGFPDLPKKIERIEIMGSSNGNVTLTLSSSMLQSVGGDDSTVITWNTNSAYAHKSLTPSISGKNFVFDLSNTGEFQFDLHQVIIYWRFLEPRSN